MEESVSSREKESPDTAAAADTDKGETEEGEEGEGVDDDDERPCSNSPVEDDPAKEATLLFVAAGELTHRPSSPVFYLEPEDWARSAENAAMFTPTLSPPSPLSRGTQARSPVSPEQQLQPARDRPPSPHVAVATNKDGTSSSNVTISSNMTQSLSPSQGVVKFLIGQDEELTIACQSSTTPIPYTQQQQLPAGCKRLQRQLTISPLARPPPPTPALSRFPSVSTFASIEESECSFDESPEISMESDLSLFPVSPSYEEEAESPSSADAAVLVPPPVLVSPPSPAAAHKQSFDAAIFDLEPEKKDKTDKTVPSASSTTELERPHLQMKQSPSFSGGRKIQGKFGTWKFEEEKKYAFLSFPILFVAN